VSEVLKTATEMGTDELEGLVRGILQRTNLLLRKRGMLGQNGGGGLTLDFGGPCEITTDGEDL